MTDYKLKCLPTTIANKKYVKDIMLSVKDSKVPIREQHKLESANVRRTIPQNVSSTGIDAASAYNGYNNLVLKIDESKTKVDKKNGIWGLGCTQYTITYYDENNKLLFTRYINEDKKTNRIEFVGENGNKTILWDNNNNNNFETMQQEVRNKSRYYEWSDYFDIHGGNYDTVTMNNSTTEMTYQRSYDFNQKKVTEDRVIKDKSK